MSAINTILFGDQTASIRNLNYQEQMKDSIKRVLQFYFAYLKQLIELVEANQDHQFRCIRFNISRKLTRGHPEPHALSINLAFVF